MLIKDLIEHLQFIYDKEIVHKNIMGEPEIVIDSFINNGDKTFRYGGFSQNVDVQRSDDGVYIVLCAKETWE